MGDFNDRRAEPAQQEALLAVQEAERILASCLKEHTTHEDRGASGGHTATASRTSVCAPARLRQAERTLGVYWAATLGIIVMLVFLMILVGGLFWTA